MSIQRWSIEDASEYYEDGTGDMVTYADHIASHAYDEAKERELFESTYDHPREKDSEGQYQYAIDRAAWAGWSACAKSRARSAE